MLKRHPHDVSLILGLAILLLGTLALMWPALGGPFLFDDEPNLQNLRVFAGQAGNLGAYLAEFNGNPGRPLAALSFLINDNAWPSDPFAFKYTNVLLHLLNGVLLFGLLRQLQKASPALPSNGLWPLLATAAWLLHPMLLSSQMLVVQRMTLLSALFCLAGLWTYVAILQHSKQWQGALLALSTLAMATVLAVLCKENGALLPVLALCLNVTLLDTVLKDNPSSRRWLLTLGCALPAFILAGYIAYSATRPDAFINREFGLLERLMTQCHVLADYLKQILMPRLSGSGIFFDDYPITRHFLASPSTAILAIGLLGSGVFALWQHRRCPVLAFAVLWFFAGHLLESTGMNLELYFEHRNYLPIIGPLVLLSALPFKSGAMRNIGLGLFGIWLVLLASITGLQARVWGERAQLATIWTTERPDSLRASQEFINYQNNIGQYQVALDFTLSRMKNGTSHADYPLTALLSVCLNPGLTGKGKEYEAVLASIPNAPFTNSAMVLVNHLREAVQANTCPTMINETLWLAISDAFLAHPKFKRIAGAYLHHQRAQLFRHKLNLDATMREMEAAYAHSPSIEQSQYIAEILFSAGLLDEAKQWLQRGLLLKKPWIKESFGASRQQSIAMLEALEQHKARQINPER